MVIVRVSYGYGYTRGSGRVQVEILGTGQARVRVSTVATGTGRVAKMVDPHTSTRDAALRHLSRRRSAQTTTSPAHGTASWISKFRLPGQPVTRTDRRP